VTNEDDGDSDGYDMNNHMKVPDTNIWKWRTVKQGASVVDNKIACHRCSCHGDNTGHWNGLYVHYEEYDHEAAVAKNK
jgi:hypothetical protein